MHPLWHLFPAIICATTLAAAVYCLIDETRAHVQEPNPWLMATITLVATTSAVAATISAAPVITWTLGALS